MKIIRIRSDSRWKARGDGDGFSLLIKNQAGVGGGWWRDFIFFSSFFKKPWSKHICSQMNTGSFQTEFPLASWRCPRLRDNSLDDVILGVEGVLHARQILGVLLLVLLSHAQHVRPAAQLILQLCYPLLQHLDTDSAWSLSPTGRLPSNLATGPPPPPPPIQACPKVVGCGTAPRYWGSPVK